MAKRKLNWITILLIAAILLLINILSNRFFVRFDLTADKQHTLSKATKNILRNLDEPITVTAYFSEDLPADISRTKRDFREMLIEYSNTSKGMIDYEFISPNEDETVEQEALQSGVRPVMINVREKDQVKQQKAFLGAVLKMGESQEVIPFMQPGAGTAMEYSLSTSIKKLAVVDKPSVGLIQGNGEPGLAELSQAHEALSILYHVENVDLNAEESISPRFKAIAMVSPADTIPYSHFQKLDQYLSSGGKLFLAANFVTGDFSTAQGQSIDIGLKNWLDTKGLQVDLDFVVDASCGSVSVQQRQGFFTINQPVQFPYIPLIKKFTDHPITKGLEQVLFEFASPVQYTGDTSVNFTSLISTSDKSGIIRTPTFFDVVNKKWTNQDFPLSKVTVAAVVESRTQPWKIVFVTDGDFAISGQQGRGKSKDNISLMVNSIDWLSDDTGLIDLRTKGVTTRPIEDLEDGKRSMLKYLNFGLPIALVLFYGLFRSQKNRSKRMRRMQQNYV